MRRALHLVLAGDLGAAELELAEAARIDSSSADVYMALANLYRARGEIGRAIQIHQNLLLQPDLSEALRVESLLSLALDFRAGGFLRRAAASFEELLEADPGNLQALRELERLRVESGDWESAIQIRRKIGAADAATPSILAHLWAGLGNAAALNGDEGGARRAFRRALSRDKNCAEVYIALGEQSLREGKARRAIGHWQRALPLHAALGPVLYPRFCEAFAQAGDLPAFESLLRDRLDENPEDAEAALWLARAMAKQGRVDEALSALRRLLDRSPDRLAAHAEIGRLLLDESRSADALKAFDELLGRLPLQPDRRRCTGCGSQDTRLHWRCPQCGEWDSFV
ncbi:MAG: tetratricopeptide repeat protein [Deltaproteobacteria bacterium]|nr:tetratricopeptide repeat protein [Deltaproteobacteria bacterium]MBW2413040.1 tetratricopeptide repeat protein [Deltaproteobacteria bacterium]